LNVIKAHLRSGVTYGVLGALTGFLLSGCHAAHSHPDAWRLSSGGRGGLAVEVLGSIDRVTYFGRAKGPNLLHIEGLNRGPRDDGEYRFFGGLYTWTSPQYAWFSEAGEPQDWPPDPAMDIGPVLRTGGARNQFSTTGPVQRSGLQEIKTIGLVDGSTATFEFELRNRGPAPVSAGPWSLSASGRRNLIAVRMKEGTTVWGTEEDSKQKFDSILGKVNPKTGWALIKPKKARWKGGIKVYIEPPPGEAAEVAFCRKGYWMYRAIQPLSEREKAQLRESGEGPIAFYVQPGRGKEQTIIETELYGPIESLEPDRSTKTVETWRIFKARGRRTSILPRRGPHAGSRK